MGNNSIGTPIELELRKLGFSENEARVYLACLEAKGISIKKISQTVSLSRPTVYRVLDSLLKKGLVEKFSRKSRSIIAKSPDELLEMLRAERRTVEEKEREFLRLISRLKSKYLADENNEIKVFEDPKSIKFFLEELSQTANTEITVIYQKIDLPLMEKLENIYKIIRKRLGKLSVKEIFPEETATSKLSYVKRSANSSLKHFPGTIIISDKIIFISSNNSLSLSQSDVVEIIKRLTSIF